MSSGYKSPYVQRQFALGWLSEHGHVDSTDTDYLRSFSEQFGTKTLDTAMRPLYELWQHRLIERSKIKYQPPWAGRARSVYTYYHKEIPGVK